MPTVDLYNLDREKVGSIDLADHVFDAEVREHLFHEIVRAQLAARRKGTAKAKERWEITGSGAKVWRQKGTGRARQGKKSAPHWVGGGVVHGPRPRLYTKKVNKRTRQAALCAALSRRQQEGRLFVIDELALPAIKTKQVAQVLSKFEQAKALFVSGDGGDGSNHFELSTRNLPTAHYLPVGQLNVYDILRHDAVLLSKRAIDALHERMA